MIIGLIAMSGVRACDEQLLQLGLTLPGFVERSKVIASLPSLGLLTLAGIQRDRHDYHYHEVADLRALQTMPGGYDLVAISSFSAQIGEAYALAERYRAAGTPVVMGGLHVTCRPDEALRYADAVVIGEGEPVWPRVIEDAVAGRLGGRYTSDGRFDLAEAPMPAYDLLEVGRYNRLTVQVSRGCPHRCEFCASSILLTDRYKSKPIAKVLAEVDRIRSIWRRPFIEVADDNAFCRRAESKSLLRELAGRSIRWFAEADVSIAEDPQLLELMYASGCHEVLIGLESPIAAGLNGVELRSNWKARKWSEYIGAIRAIQSHGIRVNGCFIVGLDGHTPEVFDAVWQFARQAELFDVQITLPTPFPGTPLHARLEREGRLTHPGQWNRCTLFDINFEPSHMSRDELRNGFLDLGRRLYAESETRHRRRLFHERHARRAAKEAP